MAEDAAGVTPAPAATVVVLHAAAGAPFEVMLLRRSAEMSWIEGAHVFPGGRVDEADLLADPSACRDGLDAVEPVASLEGGERRIAIPAGGTVREGGDGVLRFALADDGCWRPLI